MGSGWENQKKKEIKKKGNSKGQKEATFLIKKGAFL
jgi:hypothetical protein